MVWRVVVIYGAPDLQAWHLHALTQGQAELISAHFMPGKLIATADHGAGQHCHEMPTIMGSGLASLSKMPMTVAEERKRTSNSCLVRKDSIPVLCMQGSLPTQSHPPLIPGRMREVCGQKKPRQEADTSRDLSKQ